jgi:ferric-dicitrate binding protein FerR (iron transport regulator)
MDLNLLKRYFSNTYSKKEYQIVQDEFQKGDDNPTLVDALHAHWNEFDDINFPEIELDPLLDKLHHRINLEDKNITKKYTIWQLTQRIAALLFLPLLFGSLLYNGWLGKNMHADTSWAEIQCPMGVRTKFQLPDGSTGYLNSGSRLRYPVSFQNNRLVTLSGEGFFEVYHDKKSPFHVRTENLDIRVLGTTFNVAAYPEDTNEEVVLQTGEVEISDPKGTKIASLKPDQEFVLDCKNSKFKINSVIPDQYTSWKEGRLIFRNEKIEDMALRLSRWYNAEVVVDKRNSHISTYTYHGTFIDEQLEDVLKLLSITSPITAVQKERVRDKEGNYSRKKIVLSINPYKTSEFEKKN